MRIPGWMFFIVALLALVGGTALCSVLTYGATRDLVVDARNQGVDVPTLPDLVRFVLDGDDAGSGSPSGLDAMIASQPTATPMPTSAPPDADNTPTAVQDDPAGPDGDTEETPPPDEPPAEATVDDPDDQDMLDIPEINDPRRITILLMGIDQRTATGDPGPFRTDTMILAQVDPVGERVGVLSIPRDLWVTIPGFRQERINTANFLGDSRALPGGGPGLAMETIRANLGVPVDKYVRVNFEVFYEVVDTIAPDGIEICIEEPILDEKYPDEAYGFIVVQFDPGCQTLDSERLLQYARTRATEGGDFDRNRRQQEVLRAVQAHIFSMDGLRSLIMQIPTLYTQLAGSYQTNLSVEEILQLANFVSRIPQDRFTFSQITTLDVDFGETEEGQQILLPRQRRLRFVVQQTFNPQDDLTLADLRERAEAENSRIVVYNNTSISGLAGNTREWLTQRGVTVESVGNIDPPADASEIIIRDYTGKPWTARYLAELMGLPESAIRAASDGLTSADVMIVVGSDVQRLLQEAPPAGESGN